MDSEYSEEKIYLQNDKEILNVIKDTLIKINSIKGQLAQYKAKLISLEHDMNRNRTQIESQETYAEGFIDSEEKLIMNPLNFIHINQGAVKNVVISIEI